MIGLIVWGKRLLYSQLSGDKNYIASFPLKYYHTVNCLGERLLYSQLRGKYYYISSFPWWDYHFIILLGKDYYIAIHYPHPAKDTTRKVPENLCINLQCVDFYYIGHYPPSCIGWYSSIRPDNPYKSTGRRWHLFAMGEILLYSSLSLILHSLFFIKTIRQYPYKTWQKWWLLFSMGVISIM